MSKAVYLGQGKSIIYLDVLFDYPVSPVELRYIKDVVSFLSMFPCNLEKLSTLGEKKISFTITPNAAIVYNGDNKNTYYFNLDKNIPNENTQLFKEEVESMINKYVGDFVRNY